MEPVTERSGVAEVSSARPYRGVEATQRLAARRGRLLAAGLDLLGADHQGLSALTVRAVCHRAGLAARYFYESFTDKDELVSDVFEWVVADLVATTQAAVAAVPAHQQTRAGMANIVRTIADDTRIGHLLFSTQLVNPVIARKRAESSALFALLSGQHVGNALRVPANDRLTVAAHFVVGGVGQAISAWLAGAVHLEPDQLVDQLASLLDELTDPDLYRPRLTRTAAPATAASPAPAATSVPR
ncbi:TetR family transcriptional regulator [Mycobacterium haemophilum]|uniref:TetR family transcriptional regulator n=1 Tax=Mycobacterium haemophilum TaxID=29311 RepID=A0A0I9THE7_9MYCO|nr:TetR family transcriptional regulator [Mycobacterium haemophilum]KLO35381.1 TetR family transcriptional regulator [Mycobacterium haemophilum]KLO40570.1 TetR family transcriptional regulator [Mycobacterium haemophilum]KLO47988.1 TetR family transcriptional regulator [Mycobacterium haemophilum]